MTRDELRQKHPDLARSLELYREGKNLHPWPPPPEGMGLPERFSLFVDEVMLLNLPTSAREDAVALVDPRYAADFVDRFNLIVDEYLDWAPHSKEQRQFSIAVDFALDLVVRAGFGERYEPAVVLERGL